MASLRLHHKVDVTVPVPPVRIEPVVELDRWAGPRRPHRVRVGKGLGELTHLECHFMVRSKGLAELIIGEPDRASILIGETPHTRLRY